MTRPDAATEALAQINAPLDTREQGKRAGVKWAIGYVHAYAAEMNDESAKAALNTCAFHMGVDAKRGYVIRKARKP